MGVETIGKVPARVGSGASGGPPVAIWLLTGAVSVAALAVYLFAYPFHDIEPAGFDIYAYIWQTKLVGHGALSAVGARPGLPSMAALLGSAVRVDVPREVLVLMPVLGLMLALGVAGAVRLAFHLPGWMVPVIAAVVVLYPGTARVVHGYQASLLVMVILTAAVTVLVHAGGRRFALVVAGTLFAATCLAHVVLYALFAGIAGLYVLASVPAFLRQRGGGVPLLATDAGAAAATVLPAGLAGAAAIYGWLGVRPGATINTSNVAGVLRQRTREDLRRIRPYLAGPLGAIGGAFLWPRRATRPGRAMARLGAVWLGVTVTGALVGAVRQGVPGHRFLLFALPLPALAGVGVAAVGWAFVRRPGLLRRGSGFAVVAALTAAMAWGGISYFYNRTFPRVNPVYEQLRAAGVYLEAYGGGRPVVFILDRRGAAALNSAKFRSYVVKAEMPADQVARTFIFPGKLQDLQAGRPTKLPADAAWKTAFNESSRQAWTRVEPVLRNGAVVLIPQRFAIDPFKAAMAQDPGRLVFPGLYVVRGPVHRLGALPPRPAVGVVAGSFLAAALFVLLGLVGWGVARAALAPAGAGWFDVVLLSPATGAGVTVLAGFVIAAAGGDPRGPVGVATLVLVLAASFVLGLRARAGLKGSKSPIADSEHQ